MSWGYSLDVSADVEKEAHGIASEALACDEGPVASLTLSLKWRLSTLFQSRSGDHGFVALGDGGLRHFPNPAAPRECRCFACCLTTHGSPPPMHGFF